uniref:C-type LECtin n=1 Tax=Strongyloides venezuelensis TaxID=75913 RepID=A0A0K0EYB3_STRVS
MLKFITTIFILVIILEVIYASNGKCSDGYIFFNNLCYKKFDIVSVNRTDAKILCKEENSNFPIIHDNVTNEFLKSFSNNNFWIDLTCFNDTTCSWSDGSQYNYNNFQNNKANVVIGNYVYIQHNSEHANFYGIWTSENENYYVGSVICVKNASFHNQDCPPNYEYIADDNSNCYKYINIERNFNDSNYDCIKDTGHLVSIHSSKENMDIINYGEMNQNEKSFWIGLEYDSTKNTSQWVDGSNVTFLNYKEGFPNTYFGKAIEMLMINDVNSLGFWENANQENILPYICMMTAEEVSSYWDNKFSTPTPISVNTLSPEGQCPKNSFFENNGTITSPAYPKFYGDDFSCDYYLIMTNHSLVQFTITDFNIAENDILKIYEGNYIKLLAEFTGFDNNDAIGKTISTSNESSMVISFKSAKSHLSSHRGFMGYFGMYDPSLTTIDPITTTLPSIIDQTNSSSCPDNIFIDPSAQIESPGYPNPYGNNLMCYYIIEVPETKRIAISMIEHHFSLVGVELHIYNGRGETNDQIMEITKNDNNNGTLLAVSKSNFMTIVFYTPQVPGTMGDKWLLWYKTF